jgi:transposase
MNNYLFKDLTTIYKEAGVRLEYLPLYLSDYNPIEEFFSTLKS